MTGSLPGLGIRIAAPVPAVTLSRSVTVDRFQLLKLLSPSQAAHPVRVGRSHPRSTYGCKHTVAPDPGSRSL